MIDLDALETLCRKVQSSRPHPDHIAAAAFALPRCVARIRELEAALTTLPAKIRDESARLTHIDPKKHDIGDQMEWRHVADFVATLGRSDA